MALVRENEQLVWEAKIFKEHGRVRALDPQALKGNVRFPSGRQDEPISVLERAQGNSRPAARVSAMLIHADRTCARRSLERGGANAHRLHDELPMCETCRL